MHLNTYLVFNLIQIQLLITIIKPYDCIYLYVIIIRQSNLIVCSIAVIAHTSLFCILYCTNDNRVIGYGIVINRNNIIV